MTQFVAVLDSSFNLLFERASLIKAAVSRTSKAMEHPLENGASIVDHRIIQPVIVELSMLVVGEAYQVVYQQIRDVFLAGTLLIVQTRVDSFKSMMIEKMPHDESAEKFDGATLTLTLKEALFVETKFTQLKVARPRNANTIDRGQQQTTEATPPRVSVLSKVGGLFK